MFSFDILFPSVLNGLTTGAVYALIALGLTLIYGVLHIINFAHGALLMVALYAVYLLRTRLGIDPYAALPIVVPGMFVLGYALQRGVINRASHGRDENILLVTLGLAIVLENLALIVFKSDTHTIETAYTLATVAIGPAFIAVPKLVAFGGALACALVLLLIVTRTDLGRAIRAVSKEKQGARLMGIETGEGGAREIAKRSRGTPRIAGRLLRRVVDFALVEGDGRLTQELADNALTRLGVDHLGLDGADRRYLSLIAENYQGGPVGVETLSAALSESRDAIEEVIEPFLLQQGLIQRTPRGRMLAAKAWAHLGLAAPSAPGQAELF